MPLKFDDVAIPGMLNLDGPLSIGDRSPEEVAQLIIDRLE